MKRFLCWTSAILLVLAIPYAGLWIYSYDWFEKEIDRVYEEASSKGYEFIGPKPILTGFPFVPEIYYSGGFKFGNTMLVFPEARLSGYPIPGLTFHLDIPRGIALDGIVSKDLWNLDSLESDIVIPSTFPASTHADSLSAWQQAGGQFDIKNYKLTKGALQSEGTGKFSLDANLQPVIHFDSNIKGHEEFIQTLMQQGAIQPLPAAAATGIMNSLSKPDPVTNENVVTLKVSVENRLLTVGPLQVVRLPEIVWPGTHSSPDQHQ